MKGAWRTVEPFNRSGQLTDKSSSNRRNKGQGADEASPLAAVSELMAERAKYEKWLSDLEGKRASKSAKAYEKVKADYTARLNAVLEKLTEHQAAMQQHAAGLEATLRELSGEEEELTDALAEAELRFDVGEISPEEWTALSKKTEKDIARITQAKETAAADLARLRDMLAAPRPDASSAESPPDEDSESGDEDADAAAPGAAKATPSAGATPVDAKPKDVDELEFLKSVVGTPTGAIPKAPAPAPKRVIEPKPADTRAAAKPFVAEHKPSLIDQPKAADKLVSKSGREEVSEPVADANPIVLKPTASVAQHKTLKCAECGAMNNPSEWYCERCGAELTNI